MCIVAAVILGSSLTVFHRRFVFSCPLISRTLSATDPQIFKSLFPGRGRGISEAPHLADVQIFRLSCSEGYELVNKGEKKFLRQIRQPLVCFPDLKVKGNPSFLSNVIL